MEYNTICAADNDTILHFISQFKSAAPLFLNGMCYWFAHILHTRFPDSEIVYDDIIGHFACQIDGVAYDAQGVVKSDNFYTWSHYQQFEPAGSRRIIRDCIEKRKWGDIYGLSE